MLKQWVRDLKLEFKGYSARSLQADVLAGITVAAVALPLALAFGVGSGADAAAGLITAVLGGFVIGAFSGAPMQISGPTGAMAAILISVIARYGLQGMFAASLMSGVILLLAGIFRLGRLVSFIPAPVISGFTSGIAIVIALGQLGNFLGVPMEGESTLGKVAGMAGHIAQGGAVNFVAVGLGVATMLLMALWPKRWNAKLPASLVAVVLFLVVNLIIPLPVDTVGEIPRTLLPAVRLSPGSMPWGDMPHLLAPALSIAALGMIESLLCGVAGTRMQAETARKTGGTAPRFNADRELVAQGIGNMIIPFFGGVPATAAIARTSVAIKSGGRTRLTSMIHAAILLASMLLLAPVMSQIPLATLAGVLMMTAWRMNEWDEIRYFFSKRMTSAIVKFMLTLVVTVVFDLVVAIAVGVGLSVLLFVARSARLVVTVDTVDHQRLAARGVVLPQAMGEVRVAYLSGPLFFGSVDRLPEALAGHQMDLLVLSMRGVNMIDSSGLRGLEELYDTYAAAGVPVLFAAVQDEVRASMQASGLLGKMAHPPYWSTDQALASQGAP